MTTILITKEALRIFSEGLNWSPVLAEELLQQVITLCAFPGEPQDDWPDQSAPADQKYPWLETIAWHPDTNAEKAAAEVHLIIHWSGEERGHPPIALPFTSPDSLGRFVVDLAGARRKVWPSAKALGRSRAAPKRGISVIEIPGAAVEEISKQTGLLASEALSLLQVVLDQCIIDTGPIQPVGIAIQNMGGAVKLGYPEYMLPLFEVFDTGTMVMLALRWPPGIEEGVPLVIRFKSPLTIGFEIEQLLYYRKMVWPFSEPVDLPSESSRRSRRRKGRS